ncbi:MAG: hypothetical protein KGH72_04530 [Candidatus Micrarchaeota archaeon]|nr:hypothetical protein [Candidatus Micrarchaeota archaeon]
MIQQKSRVKFNVAAATHDDITSILRMVNDVTRQSGALLPVTEAEVKGWIAENLSFVAKTPDGKVIGHNSAFVWPESGWAELRAGVVLPDYRGNGVNMEIKVPLVESMARKGAKTVVGLKNKASNGHGILEALGFEEARPADVPRELFNIGQGTEWAIYVNHDMAKLRQLVRPNSS